MTSTPAPQPNQTRRTFAAYIEAVQAFDAGRAMPVNIQQQWVVLFGVVVAVVALVAGLYLDVTARAAITGRQIQNLELSIAINRRSNADYETELAYLLSNQVMQARAKSLGFEMLKQEELSYMVVPGYFPKGGVQIAGQVSQKQAISASPEFHESLIDWFRERMRAASIPMGGTR
jgi:cell division protein FtsL